MSVWQLPRYLVYHGWTSRSPPSLAELTGPSPSLWSLCLFDGAEGGTGKPLGRNPKATGEWMFTLWILRLWTLSIAPSLKGEMTSKRNKSRVLWFQAIDGAANKRWNFLCSSNTAMQWLYLMVCLRKTKAVMKRFVHLGSEVHPRQAVPKKWKGDGKVSRKRVRV